MLQAVRRKPAVTRALAVLLYGMGNMSLSMIGRLLGVSDVAVLKWVRRGRLAGACGVCGRGDGRGGRDVALYPVHARIRKSLGEMMRKLSDTASQ